MLRLAAITVFALVTLATVAHGEVFQHESLRVSIDASIAPRALPRTRPAPVTVHLGGAISTADGTRPPALQELSIEVNRAGRFSSRGLPACRAPELQQTSTKAALAACRDALVGHGSFGAGVDFPGAPEIPAAGKVLVFNARTNGRPAMLLHLYGSRPVRAAFVLPFAISHASRGRFGTTLSTRIPNLASGLGYITELQLQLGRRYSAGGRRHSFLSANCAAPAGFSAGIFPLTRMTFSFDDGRRVVGSLSRDCRVR